MPELLDVDNENNVIGEGIIAINKQRGMTSHDVVASLRKITGIRKIGHAARLIHWRKVSWWLESEGRQPNN